MSGAPADFVTIDLDRLDRDQIMPVDPIDLLFARGNASLLRDVVVDGRTIVSDGRCTGVDLPAIEQELRGIYRASAGQALRSSARLATAFRLRCKAGSKRNCDCQLSAIAQLFTNSVMRNKIPLASATQQGFMFGNKKRTGASMRRSSGHEEA